MNIIEQELKDVPKFGEKTCKVLSNLNILALFIFRSNNNSTYF